nr:hypothetical protein BgiMline_032096 [Biomphalaria glabrata]
MKKSCVYYIFVALGIILQLLNGTVAMTTHKPPETIACESSPCTKGEYYNPTSCTCRPCPPGHFNKNTTHRDLKCQAHTLPLVPECKLTKNGTNKSDTEWDCPTLETTYVTSAITSAPSSLSTPSTPWPVESSSQTLVIVIVVISAFCFILIITVIICCIWRKKSPHRNNINFIAAQPMLEKSSPV